MDILKKLEVLFGRKNYYLLAKENDISKQQAYIWRRRYRDGNMTIGKVREILSRFNIKYN